MRLRFMNAELLTAMKNCLYKIGVSRQCKFARKVNKKLPVRYRQLSVFKA